MDRFLSIPRIGRLDDEGLLNELLDKWFEPEPKPVRRRTRKADIVGAQGLAPVPDPQAAYLDVPEGHRTF